MSALIRRPTQRGFTLVEMLVAVLLLSAVMAVALSVISAGVRVTRVTEQTTGSNDSARTAAEVMMRDIRLAGTMQGVWVVDPGGTMQLTNPIYTEGGPGGTDALWIIAPRPNGMQADCTKPGSAAIVRSASSSGPLAVDCTTSLVGATTLMVTNFKRAAIITPSAMAAQSIDFDEMTVANFGPSPEKGGMQKGDMVFPVQVVRYSIGPGNLLLRAVGRVNATAFSGAAPFEEVPGGHVDRYNDVEDMQVAWGTGASPNLTFASFHAAPFNAALVPVALRLNVVGIGRLANRDETGNVSNLTRVIVEDHVPGTAPDGFRRSVYKRRVELLNNGALNL